ncbi:MAG TPA: hypothetical protein VHW01_23665 [Polyangiaceae bacterium]|jgi:hypothetical protein|nr:hypothetical protein [Polyangiaceae bacterium]
MGPPTVWLPTHSCAPLQAGPQLVSEQYLNSNGQGVPLPGHMVCTEIALQSERAVQSASVVIEEHAEALLAPALPLTTC